MCTKTFERNGFYFTLINVYNILINKIIYHTFNWALNSVNVISTIFLIKRNRWCYIKNYYYNKATLLFLSL